VDGHYQVVGPISGPELSRAKRKSLTTAAFPSKGMALTQSQKHANAGYFRGGRSFVRRYINPELCTKTALE
jgi:hypothetical protein